MKNDSLEGIRREPEGRAIIDGEDVYGALWQLACLGLEEEDILKLRGRKTLDLCCGNGNLVDYFIQREILAEGLDPIAPKTKRFMKQRLVSISPYAGSIPREDESYDLVIANSPTPILTKFSDHGQALRNKAINLTIFNPVGSKRIQETIASAEIEGPAMILEALRVLKKGGKFICFNYLNKLEQELGPQLSQGYTIEKQPAKCFHDLEQIPGARGMIQQLMIQDGYLNNQGHFPDHLKNRMIIHKN